jgi:hypothetical protein
MVWCNNVSQISSYIPLASGDVSGFLRLFVLIGKCATLIEERDDLDKLFPFLASISGRREEGQ